MPAAQRKVGSPDETVVANETRKEPLMKTRSVVALCFTLLGLSSASAAPLSTAITYQGRLQSAGAAASGTYDFQFTVYDAPSAGNLVGSLVTTNGIGVSNGLFTVSLDFGGSVFAGDARWLAVAVRTNGATSFSSLSPRQALTASAYALFAPNAGVAASVPVSALPANVAYLNANETFTAGLNFMAPLNLQNSMFMNNHNIFFRNDANHGVGWFGAGTPFGGLEPNGPVLFGYAGGALGSEQWGTEKVALAWDPSGSVTISGSAAISGDVTIDPAGVNNGSLSPGLIFGAASGEGISSKRTAGGNPYGLDFYTVFAPRMSINNSGNVGIGTTTPSVRLEVAGSERIGGMIRIGSETGAAPAIYPTGSEGLVVRRISSTSSVDGTVVARTDAMILARDGTPSGLKLQLIGPGHYTYSATGFDRGSHLVALQSSGTLPAGSYLTYPFDDSQKVVHYDISFGNPYNNGHTCHVILDRYDDGATSDNYLVGTLTSTYNQ